MKDIKQEGCLYYWCSQSGSLQYLECLQINLVYQNLAAHSGTGHLRGVLLLEVMQVGQAAEFVAKPQ